MSQVQSTIVEKPVEEFLQQVSEIEALPEFDSRQEGSRVLVWYGKHRPVFQIAYSAELGIPLSCQLVGSTVRTFPTL